MKLLPLYLLLFCNVASLYSQSVDFGYTDFFWQNHNIQDLSNKKASEKILFKYIYGLSTMSNSSKSQEIHFFTNQTNQTDKTLLFYLEIFEKVLFDPNSPFRNEGLYELILEDYKRNSILSDLQKVRIKYHLTIIEKNKIGKLASDFNTKIDGNIKNLYSIQAPYILVVFTNSECPSCIENYKELGKNEVIRNTTDSGKLKVLMVDNSESPTLTKGDQWIWAKDIDDVIDSNEIYYTPALPSIYLMDKNKRVILKDVPLEAVTKYFLNQGAL
ncbi:DUF5106 domain-containing protein [Flammeovirga sp. EKP202]|uniref:DUF5106 domain-containing protein n=1 Tax=Flammeovirga sp. EKP202 TaxID=2770592 RepID=UPI00165FFE3A|nr:DUF5106 domain-containing protein [Flammeovirga sp. EKP202]MBD0403940.1 DUF5106 domain-containing protein [Flammeovirga sp. EKP202]